MFGAIQRNWQEFAQSEPGRRFEQRYYRRGADNRAKRVLASAGGVVLLALGLFFVLAPGPGILFLLPGAALIAQQSLTLAQALDRAELWLRNKVRRRGD